MVFTASFLNLFLVLISGLGSGPLDAPLKDLDALAGMAGRGSDPFVVDFGRSPTATMRILGAAALVFCLASLLAAAEPKIGIAKCESKEARGDNLHPQKKTKGIQRKT
jgi:hypothetical protein